MKNYSIRYWKDGDGWSYELRDPQRRFVGQGWSRGKKSDAEQDARARIAELQARAVAA